MVRHVDNESRQECHIRRPGPRDGSLPSPRRRRPRHRRRDPRVRRRQVGPPRRCRGRPGADGARLPDLGGGPGPPTRDPPVFVCLFFVFVFLICLFFFVLYLCVCVLDLHSILCCFIQFRFMSNYASFHVSLLYCCILFYNFSTIYIIITTYLYFLRDSPHLSFFFPPLCSDTRNTHT